MHDSLCDDLTCGHPCPGSCGHCHIDDHEGNRIIKHSKCDKVCGRHFGTCDHTCIKRCRDGSDCGLCMAKCEVSTVNSLHQSSSLIMYRWLVNILVALSSATKHAHHASSDAHGPAHTRESANCLVQPPVTVFHATSVAPSSFLALTTVPGFAEKIVFQITAWNVG